MIPPLPPAKAPSVATNASNGNASDGNASDGNASDGNAARAVAPRALVRSVAEEARAVAVRALAVQGEGALPALLGQLADPSWTVRREVVAAVASMGAPAVAPLCALLVSERHNEARIAATVDSLVQIDAPEALTEVSKLAQHRDPAIVADAAQILGRRHDGAAVPALRALVMHENDNVAVAAIEALGRIGGASAVDSLIEAVQHASFFRAYPAIDVLGRSGDPRAVEPLAALLPQPQYTAEAARALGNTGQLSAIAPLASLLAIASESIARVAAVAISEIEARHTHAYGSGAIIDDALRRSLLDPRAVSRLCRALHNAAANEALAIVTTLGAVGGDDAVVAITGLLGRSDVADEAARTLKKIGHDSHRRVRDALQAGSSDVRSALLPVVTRASASAEILACSHDADAKVRALACDALSRVGALDGVPRLFELLADDSPPVQQAALAAIQALGSNETKALALRDARATNARVRRLALRLLGTFGYREALPILLDALADDDVRIREAGVLGLAHVEGEAALDALLTALRSADDKMRAVAARALGSTNERSVADAVRVKDALLQALVDVDAWVRYYACQALGRLRVEDAVNAITPLLADAAGQVRVAAVEALALVRTPAAIAALCDLCEPRNAKNVDADMQRAALVGLGAAATETAARVVLLRAAGSSDAATRLVAVSALADSNDKAVLPTLAAAARDPDENVAAAALGFLWRLDTRESSQLLVDLLRAAPRGPSADRIAAALARPSKVRVAVVVTALERADETLAATLVSCLARHRSADAEAGLVRALQMSSVIARKAAATTLGNLRTAVAMAALRAAATGDENTEVRRICHVLISQ